MVAYQLFRYAWIYFIFTFHLCYQVTSSFQIQQRSSFTTTPPTTATTTTTRFRRLMGVNNKWIENNDKETIMDRFSSSSTYLESFVENFFGSNDNYKTNPKEMKKYLQIVTLTRVCVPSLFVAVLVYAIYPSTALQIFGWINDSGAIDVIANDYSQYIQNVLNVSGLMFTIIVGYTYYFLYQQQEAIYLALFNEVSEAKSLLEQTALVSQGRREMYHTILDYIDHYVHDDLTQFFIEPSELLSSRPIDDPLEQIMYMTSVGEPSIVYQTVRSLRQARAARLGALQRKLPPIHFILVYTLAFNIIIVFPLLGAGSQTIGGWDILHVQAIYLGMIVFGIGTVLGVLNELNQPTKIGAYNVVSVLNVMVIGLLEEIGTRQSGIATTSQNFSPQVENEAF
jgi:Protein of unknown function (DUF4239)